MALSNARYDYVTVGHVTRDVIERPVGHTVSQPGGGAFYSALQAARLGLRTLILTQGVPSEIRALLAPYLPELELHVIPAAHTTTLATFGSGSTRTQRVLAWAGPIVEPIELDTRILHLAPIARETPTVCRGTADFLGITPQGLLRCWQRPDRVGLVQLDAGSLLGDIPLAPPEQEEPPAEITLVSLDPTLLPDSFDAAVISERERYPCQTLFPAARHRGAPVAVTAGARPTTVHLPARAGGSAVLQTSVPPALSVREDIGAGDVFAAAFFIALTEGRGPLEAAVCGNAAAGVRLTGLGPDAVGRGAEIENALSLYGH